MVRSPSIVPGTDRGILELDRAEGDTGRDDSCFETSSKFAGAHGPIHRPSGLLRAAKLATCAVLLSMFLWPAIYNGQPLFSPDTGAYIRGFDAGVVWLTGRTTAWTTWASERPEAAAKSTAEKATRFQTRSFIIAGRSVSYGALLYLGELLGGLWASIVIQACVALAAVGLTLRHLRLFSWLRFVLTAVTLGFASSLPFFTSFLLPDIFAGLALLAAANLLALGHRLRRWEQVFWVSILGAAAVFHPSHVAIIMLLLIAAIIAKLLNKKVARAGIVALTVAAGLGLGSETVFALVVQRLLGVPVDRPPVVMARIVADGPGASYLRGKCPQAGLVACEFVDRLTSNSDAFLWDTSPASGVYAPASVEKRRQLGNEQFRFAAAVLAYDPVGQIAAWLNDGFQQLKMVGLSEFAADAEQALPSLPGVYAKRMAGSPFLRRDFPIEIFSQMTIFVSMLSVMFVCVILIRYWKAVSAEQKIFCFVILFGEVSNALICGALSGPHQRYQARLTWLLPVVALLLLYERWLRSEVLGWLDVSGPLAPDEAGKAAFSPARLEHSKIVLNNSEPH